MDDPNITMEEYIRLHEEKAQRAGRTFNWQTATYGMVKYYEDEDDCFTNFKSEFLAIVFNYTSDVTLCCEPTVSLLNDNKIDFRISFEESDDEDYTIIYDENSFSYKIIYVNNLKTDSKNDNDKVNMPLFSTPEPEVSYSNDLDFFKDFENKFLAIVYNDALTSKSDFLTEPTVNPQHIDEFNETSLSECDEEEQNILYFNDLFPFNIIFRDGLKLDEENDGKNVDTKQPTGEIFIIPSHDMINTDVGAYAQGSIKILKTSHDTSRKIFKTEIIIMKLNVDIMTWNYIHKDMALPPRDQRHQYLRFEGLEYTDADITDFEERLGRIYGKEIHRVESVRQIPDKGDLSAYWVGISSAGDFLGTTLSYTLIRDLMLRLCHRLIACSIAGRSHALEKVTGTDLFYLRGRMLVQSTSLIFWLGT
ncbi:hypothetical protein Tco_1372150 [Tanacetum coccineum]